MILTAAAGPCWAAAASKPYESCFQIAAKLHGVPADLLLAVAAIESAYNPDARSNKDAHGIMQIQWPGTARHLGVRRVSELYNPCLNIELGARYLRELLDANNGDVQRALAAYNYGPGRIARSPELPAGAVGYADKVLTQRASIEARTQQRSAATLDAASAVTFDSKHRAERFARTLNDRIAGAKFVSTRTRDGAYQVAMAPLPAGLSATDLATLEALGWSELGGAP
jgi:membrane-bound lytic murein transglycosylase MltF